MAGRKFAVFDIDGTLIRWQLYHSVADTLAQLGFLDPKLHQTIRESRMAWKRRAGTFSEYERQVVKVYDTAITKLSKPQFETAAQAVFDEYKDQVYTYTRDLIAKLKQDGYLLFAISGSQTEIVKLIADYYGFDDFVGSVYEYKSGLYTGQKTIGSHGKDKTLSALVKKHGANFEGSCAIGDSQSDIAMLEMADSPIAFNPEEVLFECALEKGWTVVVERKNVIYQLESRDGKYQLATPN